MKPEESLSLKVKEYFLSLSPHVKAIRKDQSQYSGNTGISDWLVCVGGLFVAIELKVDKNKPSKKQEIFLKEVREAGGAAFACWSLNEVKQVIKAIMEESDHIFQLVQKDRADKVMSRKLKDTIYP